MLPNLTEQTAAAHVRTRVPRLVCPTDRSWIEFRVSIAPQCQNGSASSRPATSSLSRRSSELCVLGARSSFQEIVESSGQSFGSCKGTGCCRRASKIVRLVGGDVEGSYRFSASNQKLLCFLCLRARAHNQPKHLNRTNRETSSHLSSAVNIFDVITE